MVTMQLTPNYAGVRISGNRDDFEAIVDAIYDLTIDEGHSDYLKYHTVSIRTLGLCYDIRHAAMGHREVEMIDEDIVPFLYESEDEIVRYREARFSCHCLLPEMCFVIMALDCLMDYRGHSKAREKWNRDQDPRVIWDPTIALMRSFQSIFIACVEKELAPAAMTRFRNSLHRGTQYVADMHRQFLDLKNIEFIGYSPEKRKRSISLTAKHLSEYFRNPEYRSLAAELELSAAEYGVHPSELTSRSLEYPEEHDW